MLCEIMGAIERTRLHSGPMDRKECGRFLRFIGLLRNLTPDLLPHYVLHVGYERLLARKKILILTALLLMVSAASAQYRWTMPVPIDTSSHPSDIGGALAVDDSGQNIYVAFASTDAGKFFVVHSTDQGSTWRQYENVGQELSRVPRDIVVDHNGNVWLLWISWYDEFSPAIINLSRSIDSGRTFTTLFSSFSYSGGYLFQKLAVDGENSIYMLWDDAWFKVTKFRYGDIGQRVDAEIPKDTLLVGSFPALAVSKDFVVHCAWEGSYHDPATGYHEFVFYSRSNDTGLTLQGKVLVDTAKYPAIAVDSLGTIFVSYTTYLSDIRFVRSLDRGRTFLTPLIVSDSDTSYWSGLCVDSESGINILWDSHSGTKHRRSINAGISFSSTNYVGNIGFHDVKCDRRGLVCATGEYYSRLYFAKTDITLSAPEDNVIPNTFALSQNYPNPLNPTTVIKFSMPHSSSVSLRVFDLLGQEIATLVSGEKSPGQYEVEWDASGVSSGIYFYELRAGNFRNVKKMILIK